MGHKDAHRRRLLRTPGPRLVTAALAGIGLTASFMFTLVIPIQGRLPEFLGASPDDTAWVITATLLGGACFIPISGRLGDLYGKRRVLLVLLAVMVLGSIVAALSSSLAPLIVGRFLQGISSGSISLGIAILRDVLPRERLGSAIAMVSATLGVGSALGLPLGAVVSESLEWRAIFWMSAGLGGLAFLAAVLVVPPSVLRSPGSFDWPGAAGLALGLSGMLLAVSKGGQWGWTSPLTLGLGLGGTALLVLWGAFELRRPSPLIDLRVSARPPVLFTNLASIAMGFAMFGSNIALPQLLSQAPGPDGAGVGLGLTQTGLLLMTGGLVMMLVSPIAGRLIDRYGARSFLIAGAGVIVVGYLAFLLVLDSQNPWLLAASNAISSVGVGLGFAAMPTLIMQAVPPTETAAANGLNTLMRSLGTTAAATIIGTVLAHSLISDGATSGISADGFRTAFLLGAGAGLVSVLLACFIPRRIEQDGCPTSPDDD